MRTQRNSILLAMLVASIPTAAAADLVWGTAATTVQHQTDSGHDGHAPGAAGGQRSENHGGHVGHRGAEVLHLTDPENTQISLWHSDLRRTVLTTDNGALQLKPTGVDSYHALVAERTSDNGHESAMRYVVLRGKPSGHSPAELLALEKVPLEIVPDPLPREHHRYLSERPAKFLLRFQGKPLADAAVIVQTSNGAHYELTTDTDGRFEIQLPGDFGPVKAGRRRNPPADFVVRTQHRASGKYYRASLSAPYYVNPRHWQSNRTGLAAALSGFAVGLGILGIASRHSSTPSMSKTS
ncbi:MAG: hypothetical protein Kow006_20080 [Gammaproteobacteria bacterium]